MTFFIFSIHKSTEQVDRSTCRVRTQTSCSICTYLIFYIIVEALLPASAAPGQRLLRKSGDDERVTSREGKNRSVQETHYTRQYIFIDTLLSSIYSSIIL